MGREGGQCARPPRPGWLTVRDSQPGSPERQRAGHVGRLQRHVYSLHHAQVIENRVEEEAEDRGAHGEGHDAAKHPVDDDLGHVVGDLLPGEVGGGRGAGGGEALLPSGGGGGGGRSLRGRR